MDGVPILKIGTSLLVPIQVDLSDQSALDLQEQLADRIVSSGATGVLIDISALEIVDSFIGRMLASIAAISRVLDAACVVVGMRPAVAITMVELGLSFGGVHTALDVDKGTALLARLTGAHANGSGVEGSGPEGAGGAPGGDASEGR
jgi:rsbT antagonist protein RsbS